MRKTFVLDTNVLLHSPEALDCFADNLVVLPMAVIEELDHFKSRHDELGRNARWVIRHLDRIRQQGRLNQGVPLAQGGLLKIVTGKGEITETGLDVGLPDNKIIRVAYRLLQAGENVIFVSKDINARLKADALGILVEDFEKQKVRLDDLFTGYREVDVPGDMVDAFYETDTLVSPDFQFCPNEFILLRDQVNPKHSALARAERPDALIHLNARFERAWNIKPRSKEQRLAFELLLDPSVQLVTLVGRAGTGKTLLALAAALHVTLRSRIYDKVLFSRPIVPLGKDIGYLPGAKDEKLFHWMQPIYDNLAYLLRDDESSSLSSSEKRIAELKQQDLISLEAITYIRGRNIPRQYVIVDEAQNLTPHEVKTIISRAGEGTKMVLTGDPDQIDNPYLDSASNGLIYTAERLKGCPEHGHVTLLKSERSTLAAMAVQYL